MGGALLVAAFALIGGQGESPDRSARMPSNIQVVSNIEFSRPGSRALKLDVYSLKTASLKPEPCVIYIHGGGWREGRKDQPNPVLWELVREGFIGVAIEYRFSQEEVFPAQIVDCKAAIRFLRENASRFNIDPTEVGVWGPSAGGHLAALMGVTDGSELSGQDIAPSGIYRPQAVVDLFGPVDFVSLIEARRATPGANGSLMGERAPENQLIGGDVMIKREAARRASPLTYVSPDDPPFLIIHGTADTVVPASQSKMLADTLKEAGVRVQYKLVPEMGHELRSDLVKEWIVDFFNKELR